MKSQIKILLLMLLSIPTYSQVGFHHFELRDQDIGKSRFMTVYKNNGCQEYTDLVVDFGNFTVPDKIIITTPKGDTLTETDWVGSFTYSTQMPSLIYGFCYYHNGNLQYQSSGLPLDFGLDYNTHLLHLNGTGRIFLRTKEDSLIIEWKANYLHESHTDIFIHASSFFEEVPNMEYIDNFVCEVPEIEYDTTWTKCNVTITHNHYVGEEGVNDTICGFLGDYVDFQGHTLRIEAEETLYFDEVNDFGCEYQDTLTLVPVKLYIPNVCTDYYYLNPEIEFKVYDRWGNLVHEGVRWDSRGYEKGVYALMVEYKGRLFTNSITKL